MSDYLIEMWKKSSEPKTNWDRFCHVLKNRGFLKGVDLACRQIFNTRKSTEFYIYPDLALYPLVVRSESSDLEVSIQIFIEQEYQCLNQITNPSLVIDCGANVGYSSAYFLSQFSSCHVVAIEPDESNFDLLSRNLAPYGNRATAIRAGVWPYSTQLSIVGQQYRDGREWTKQVQECQFGVDGSFPGIDIGSVLKDSGEERISILKIDIEGAEAKIFSQDGMSWLEKVDVIAIELHDDSEFGNATEAFYSAIHQCPFEISKSGELIICKRKSI